MRYIILCLLLITGCSTVITPPTTNYTKDLKPISVPYVMPEALVTLPDAVVTKDVNGVEYMSFDIEGANTLLELQEQSEKNADIVRALNDTLIAITNERNALTNLAKEQEQRANNLAEIQAHTEEKLRHEEKMRTLEKFGYQLLLILSLL